MQAFWWLFIGGLADYADGLIARALGVNSELGKELDSIADMVSFGVVPGMIVYKLISIHFGDGDSMCYFALPGFIVSVFSGLRLARFNLDTRQSDDFIGLATPSTTLFFVGLMLIYHFNSFGWAEALTNPYLLIPLVLLFSFLMVSEIKMFSFKFKGFKWKGNENRFIFVAISIALLVFLKEAAFATAVLLYVLINITLYLFSKK